MGIIIKADCIGCGFEKELHTGGGIQDCNLETIMSVLPEDEQKVLSEAIKQGASRITINREPCSCSVCKEVYAVAVVSYTLNGDEHTVCGVCPSCRSKEHTKLSICPVCQGALSLSEAGLWD